MNTYYVYYHKFSTGQYYIGRGTGKRKFSDVSRSSTWHELTTEPYTVGIYADNLTEQEAHSIEQDIIRHPLDWDIINLSQSVHRVPLHKETLSELVYYDPTSPSGLRWNVSRSVVKKDGVAGSLNKKIGYYQVKINSKLLYVHRVIWALFNDDPGSLVINHIDNIRTNNNIDNLEPVTYAQNSQRTKAHN
jgi:hypothetical protein